MRLKESEIRVIKEIIYSIFKDAKIYLFGSRLDNNKKGGDIDLFIISKDNTLQNGLKAQAKLKRVLYKPVDIVLHRDFNRDIEKEAIRGILL